MCVRTITHARAQAAMAAARALRVAAARRLPSRWLSTTAARFYGGSIGTVPTLGGRGWVVPAAAAVAGLHARGPAVHVPAAGLVLARPRPTQRRGIKTAPDGGSPTTKTVVIALAAPAKRRGSGFVDPYFGVDDGQKGSFQFPAGRLPAVSKWIADRISPSTRSFVAKIQAPLDLSDDARGGMGQMTPATLLLHDRAKTVVRLVTEDETGHTALLRLAIKRGLSKVYVHCEIKDGSQLCIHTDEDGLPPQTQDW